MGGVCAWSSGGEREVGGRRGGVGEPVWGHAGAGTDAAVEEVLLFGFEFGAIEMKDEEGRCVQRVR
jgi:hypothetical protein